MKPTMLHSGCLRPTLATESPSSLLCYVVVNLKLIGLCNSILLFLNVCLLTLTSIYRVWENDFSFSMGIVRRNESGSC